MCVSQKGAQISHRLCWARLRGHFAAAGVPIKRRLHEFRVTPDALLPVGTEVTAAHFVPGQYVDIRGTPDPELQKHELGTKVSATLCARRT